MSRSFQFSDPAHFTVGTVGRPGARTFYLQVGDDSEVVSFKVEKQQVAALAEYLAGVLADLPEVPEPLSTAPELLEPLEPEWTVGGIGIAVDEDSDRVLLIIHELVPEPAPEDDDGGEPDEVADLLAELTGLDLEDDESDDDDLFDEDSEGALARLRLTRSQVAALVVRAGELMAAGRPLCPFCGLPSDPDGHFCPRAN